MTPHDKHATLLVDEMKITPGYQYDISLKEVLGLCTMPNGTGEYEEHTEIALVFMLCGLCMKWKQTICHGHEFHDRSPKLPSRSY
jgi:hypothetical protein